jgi:cytochrome c-type biogenesis protein CcmF
MTVAATIAVTKGTDRVATLRPAKHVYLPRQEPGDEVAIAGGPARDIWVNLAGLTGGVASIHVFVNPLISWIWIGGLILLLGSIIAAWPPPRGVRATAPAPDRTRVRV